MRNKTTRGLKFSVQSCSTIIKGEFREVPQWLIQTFAESYVSTQLEQNWSRISSSRAGLHHFIYTYLNIGILKTTQSGEQGFWCSFHDPGS